MSPTKQIQPMLCSPWTIPKHRKHYKIEKYFVITTQAKLPVNVHMYIL